MSTQVSYGMTKALNVPFETAVERITEALKAQGFGILTEIDVKATLKKKLDVDFRRYVILGACNPPLAHRALSTDIHIGLMLPCNVVVYEDESGTGSVVEIADPIAMLGIANSPDLLPIAQEARERLQKALDALEG